MSQSGLNSSADRRISLISWANDVARNLNVHMVLNFSVIGVAGSLCNSCIFDLLIFISI